MYYSLRLLCLAAAFLVPNSQALLSDQLQAGMTTAGYYCSLGGNRATVSIHYGDSASHLPCSVGLQKNQGEVVSLLEAKRHLSHCETKAIQMQKRLHDRGWQCLSSGI